jgi:hypothetical protein
VSNVFETAELLERILGKLHPFDLARAARVCSQWQDLVENSKKLQRALFLLPVQDTLTYFHPDPAPDTNTGFPARPNQNGSGIWSSSPYSIQPIRIFINPLAQARPDWFLPGRQQSFIPTAAASTYWTADLTMGTSITTAIPAVDIPSASNNATASVNNPSATKRARSPIPDFFGKAWQRMLLTQPPMGDVTMRWRDQMGLSTETPTVTYDAENELFKGVSMVQMRKLAKEMEGENVAVDGLDGMERLGCAEDLE